VFYINSSNSLVAVKAVLCDFLSRKFLSDSCYGSNQVYSSGNNGFEVLCTY